MSSILVHDESASLTRTGKTSLEHFELLAHLFTMAGGCLLWTAHVHDFSCSEDMLRSRLTIAT